MSLHILPINPVLTLRIIAPDTQSTKVMCEDGKHGIRSCYHRPQRLSQSKAWIVTSQSMKDQFATATLKFISFFLPSRYKTSFHLEVSPLAHLNWWFLQQAYQPYQPWGCGQGTTCPKEKITSQNVPCSKAEEHCHRLFLQPHEFSSKGTMGVVLGS